MDMDIVDMGIVDMDMDIFKPYFDMICKINFFFIFFGGGAHMKTQHIYFIMKNHRHFWSYSSGEEQITGSAKDTSEL